MCTGLACLPHAWCVTQAISISMMIPRAIKQIWFARSFLPWQTFMAVILPLAKGDGNRDITSFSAYKLKESVCYFLRFSFCWSITWVDNLEVIGAQPYLWSNFKKQFKIKYPGSIRFAKEPNSHCISNGTDFFLENPEAFGYWAVFDEPIVNCLTPVFPKQQLKELE